MSWVMSVDKLRPVTMALAVLSSLVLVVWVLARCSYGFELTDEGYYLNWISHPWYFDASITQFGFIFHPLYLLTGGDIALLRQFNVGLLVLLGFSLSYFLLWSIGSDKSRPPTAILVCSSLAVASSTLVLFSPWLPTPSYNSLVLQSLILAAIGAILAGRDHSTSSVCGWFLIGLGGGLAFLSKPPSALMLSLLMMAYLAIAGKITLRGVGLAVAAATVVVGVVAISIDGTLPAFVRRLAYGKYLAEVLQAGHQLDDLFRLDRLEMSSKQAAVFTLLAAAAFASVRLAILARLQFWLWAIAMAAMMPIFLILAAAGGLVSIPVAGAFSANQLLAISTGIAVAWFASPGSRALMTRDIVGLLVLFLLLPGAYAFGSNNNLWAAAERAGVFWLIAGLVLCAAVAAANRAYEIVPLISTLALLVTCSVLIGAMERPYRQTRALRLQAMETEISGSGSRLLLDEDGAAYVSELRRQATAAGFRAGDPLLDLTGKSPGSAYILGARPPGVAWIFDGYPGTTDYLTAALELSPCEVVGASWVLVERPSARALSVDALRNFGIDAATHLAAVASVQLTRGFEPRNVTQILLKPVHGVGFSREVCESAKTRQVAHN
jgi:hypothetical protein